MYEARPQTNSKCRRIRTQREIFAARGHVVPTTDTLIGKKEHLVCMYRILVCRRQAKPSTTNELSLSRFDSVTLSEVVADCQRRRINFISSHPSYCCLSTQNHESYQQYFTSRCCYGVTNCVVLASCVGTSVHFSRM